ncbi:MAG: hypothetical protein ABEK10_03085 [Candidatus Nanosalina sp.]
MKATIKPTQDPEKLKENLEKRADSVNVEDGELEIEIPEGELKSLERIPGVKSFEAEGEKVEGLKGRPVQEPAYARLDSRRDLAEAVLATIQGYDLKILNTERQWDLKALRKFNPDVKHLKHDQPVEVLGIGKTLDEEDEEREYVGPNLSDKDLEAVYRFAVPDSEQYSDR